MEINFSKNDYPVTQGEVIAFSGESGAGGPHLHFEIFDKKEILSIHFFSEITKC